MSYLGEKDYMPKCNPQTIAFLEKIITSESLVLETGSGNTTIWFARRVKEVIALENRKEWFDQVVRHLLKQKSTLISDNAEVIFDAQYYKKSISDVLGKKRTVLFDIVLLDGPNPCEARLELVKYAHLHVAVGGYLIVDDTDRVQYVDALKYLDNLGWEKIEISRASDAWGSPKAAVIYRKSE